MARSSPQLNPKEPEWRRLTRDHRGHLAPTRRDFVDAVVAGLPQLGGEDGPIVDEVPPWWRDGHRQAPTGRPRGPTARSQGPPAPQAPQHELTSMYLGEAVSP